MNHGYDDDEDDVQLPPALPQFGGGFGGGPGGLLAQLMGGAGMGLGRFAAPPPSAYDEYYKAYSVAVMGGNERYELMYGGKIIMPPSALARLTALDIQSPWTFQLRNPRNPTVNMTHAGVLEFIADNGIVYLPAWMMNRLGLNEGDPLRINGTKLPKGKMVKIQAQSVDFLEVSDPKAVLESALRNFSALSKGDIIEITYNHLTFEFLIMETVPDGPGISVIDTDLEVDFATPVGYVEPQRAAPAPVPTMADKLKIDLNGTTPASAGSSRPASVASTRPGGSGDSTPLESFTGVGQSLNGRRVKGKGLAKKIEEVDPNSKISRASGPRIITPESLADADRKVPVALKLPAGKFFFGFTYVPFDPSKGPKKATEAPAAPRPFRGEGSTLRRGAQVSNPTANGASNGKSPAPASSDEAPDPWAQLGGGNVLSVRGVKREREKEEVRAAPQPDRQEVIDATMLDEEDFFYDPDFDESEVIEIDSD